MDHTTDTDRTNDLKGEYNRYIYKRVSSYARTAEYRRTCRRYGLDPEKSYLENLDLFAARCSFGKKDDSEVGSGEAAEMQNKLCMMLLQPFNIYALEQSELDAKVIEGISSFYADRIKNYNPEYSFSRFFMYQVPCCMVDNYREDNDMVLTAKIDSDEIEGADAESHRPRYIYKNVSFNEPIGNENENEEDGVQTRLDLHEDERVDVETAVQDSFMLPELGARAAAALLNLDRQPLSKKDNAVRRNYFHLIYTDRIVYSIRNIEGVWNALQRHEREILQPMKPLFLPFTLELDLKLPELDESFLAPDGNFCRLDQICFASVRSGDQVLSNGTDEPLEEPFPADVLVAYLRQKEGIKSTREQISQNSKYFREFMTGAWKEAGE
ncbi:MAG: hypothetical protein K6C12_11345 [Oscillospiraceae bacterium]|nr:hypothetical protein [Oscillospiraceae bacterium]